MNNAKKNVAVVGAGLVGALVAIYLVKRGYRVSVYERRADLRKIEADEGRSINLAISERGIHSLHDVGLESLFQKLAVPMHGRMVHDQQGNLNFQGYGKEGQFINSVSRKEMTEALIGEAEKQGVKFFFEHRCRWVDLDNSVMTLQSPYETISPAFDIIIGADGAFSAVRSMMQMTERFNYSQQYLEHGYKELTIPSVNGGYAFEKNALHIWPRESYMLIALPNTDGSFTSTLFLAYEGDPSFAMLKDEQSVIKFFKENFPDALKVMPGLAKEFTKNPASSLATISCYPWAVHHTFLIGDAAHAMVPFFGQGLNSGFEDCAILNELLDQHKDDWDKALSAFQHLRKPDGDAIAKLALDNFVEMRDLVADPQFILRKKIESRIHELYPEQWIPLYSMVTFNRNIPYSRALEIGLLQQAIMDDVMKTPALEKVWTTLDFKAIADRLESQKNNTGSVISHS